MDDNTPTPSEETNVPPKSNAEDLFLLLGMFAHVKLNPEPFETFLPTWPNDIVVSEFFRMLIPYVEKHPELNKDVLTELSDNFIKAYLNEKYNHANPFIDHEKRLKWERMHLKLLAAKTIDESYAIVEDAAKDGFRFKKEYVVALIITKNLKEMEAKGMLEQAMEELFLANYFNKLISRSRELEQNEQESKIKILAKAEKKYRKLKPFLKYLYQVEDEWHNKSKNISASHQAISETNLTELSPTEQDSETSRIPKDAPSEVDANSGESNPQEKIVSKKSAIESVFMSNAENDEFIALFREHFGININDKAGAELAKKELTKMVDKYTKLWYDFNNGVSKNGHKRQRRQPHPDRVKKLIGESVKKTHARKNKKKKRNRPAKSGKGTRQKTS